MVTLTLQNKKTLIEMLRKHYTIDESNFIKAIAQDEEEEVELTLKAFSLRPFSTQESNSESTQESNSEFRTVQIDHVDGKLTLIKAIKETTSLTLAASKAIADQIMCLNNDKVSYNPFKVSKVDVNNKNYILTITQWLLISEYLRKNFGMDSIKWHYV